MNERRLEVADIFRTYEKDFFAHWGHVLGPSRGRPSKRFVTAAPRPSAGTRNMRSSAIRAAISSSRITRAATDTAPSVKRPRVPSGWRLWQSEVLPGSLFPRRIHACRNRSAAWRSRMRA